MNLFGDRTKLQRWARTAAFGDDTDALVDRAFQIEEAIIRYALPAYVVEDATTEALRLIFSRINSSGVPLKEEQVFEALFGDDSASKPLAQLASRLDEQTRFGRLPERWLLRCVKAVGSLDARKRYSELEPPPPEIISATGDGMRLAIRFLQAEAGFVHESVLPYRFPLIVLARFFVIHPMPHPRTRTLLTRWVWRGALSAEHGDSSYAAVRAHLDDVGEDEHDSVQRLIRRAPAVVSPPDPYTKWYGQAAATRLYATLQASLGPLDPRTEEPWDWDTLLAHLSNRELGEAFRRPFADGPGSISGRVLLPPGYGVDKLRGASAEVLRSLGIDEPSASALRDGDADRFVTCRGAYLAAELVRLVRLKAAPGESDRPPLSIVAAG